MSAPDDDYDDFPVENCPGLSWYSEDDINAAIAAAAGLTVSDVDSNKIIDLEKATEEDWKVLLESLEKDDV